MKHACTVIPLRAGQNGLEVLMVRRKGDARFFKGAYVFPGGIVEPTDHSNKYCALREMFEEVGILLEPRENTTDLDLKSLRKECTQQPAKFAESLSLFDLPLAESRLKEWSHWITPKQEKWRYDTRFFVCLLTDQEAQMAAADDDEVFSQVFSTPTEFLRRHFEGDIQLPPPTWLTLKELEAFNSSPEKVLNAFRSMARIEPTILKSTNDGCVIVAMPGDRDHQDTPPGSSALRRIEIDGSKGLRWTDTIGNTTIPHSSL